MSYDAAGNLTTDSYTGAGARTYDAENRMINAAIGINSSSVYAYDASGKRVRRSTPDGTVWQVYGFEGELLAEYAASAAPSSPQKEYGYRNGELLVTAQGTATAVNVAAAAQGATATASSLYPNGVYTAASTINGDRRGLNWGAGGGWNDGTPDAYPDWLQVDFSGSKTITEIDVFTTQDNYAAPSEPTEAMTFSLYGLTAYEVQYWTGTAWAAIPNASVTGNNKIWRKFTFAALTTQKIRVVTSAGLASYSRLTEVEAYQATQATANEAVQWLVSDHLGTPRMVADLSGSLTGIRRHDYLPFGEEIGAGVGGRTTGQGYVADNVRQQFTGYERDDETGLDYAQARYFSNVQGRFTSVDPALSSGKPAEPQSWNRYTYVLNNPLLYTDPTGLIWGYQDFTENGKNKRRFQWFDGDTVGEGFTTYNSSHYVGSDEVVWLSSNSNDYLRISKDRFTDEQFASLRGAQGADSTSFSQEQLDTVNRGIALTYGGTWQYGLMKGFAGATGGIAGGLGAASNFTFGAASRQASRLPPVLFHYTDDASAALIQGSQLGRPSGQLFLTNNGGLTPLQAQLELALPAQNGARALFAVDTQVLNTSNLLRSGRVAGNVFGRPGGGFEFQFRGTTVPQGSFTRFRF